MNRNLIYSLLRLSLSNDDDNLYMFENIDDAIWLWAYNLLSMHGVAALVCNGIERKGTCIKIPADVVINFVGASTTSLRSYAKLDNILNRIERVVKDTGVKCLLLKGKSLAAYYTRPELRKFLDIDLYAPNASKLIDESFANKGVKVDSDFYRHSHMTLNGVLVENHHCLLDVRGRKRMAELDADLKAMALEHLDSFDAPGLYYPDVRFSLIFNLHHAMSHFIYEGISFKFLVDWISFLRKEKDLLSSEATAESLRKHGVLKFAAVMSEVSVRHLGMSIEEVPECIRKQMTDLKPSVVARFLDDLFRPYEPSHKKNLLAERINNVRRIIKSAWKPKEFLGQSAIGFVWGKFLPILMGKKFEAD